MDSLAWGYQNSGLFPKTLLVLKKLSAIVRRWNGVGSLSFFLLVP